MHACMDSRVSDKPGLVSVPGLPPSSPYRQPRATEATTIVERGVARSPPDVQWGGHGMLPGMFFPGPLFQARQK